MSVSEDTRPEGFAGASAAPAAAPPQRDGQFDRTPPQDVAAEQCVLGGMLLSKDAIADVVEILRTTDFYRPDHATIFDVDPRPVRAGRAGRPDHGRGRADRLRRPGPGRRRRLPAHADLDGTDRGQRVLLRADRQRAGRAAPAGRGRHPDRADGLRHRRPVPGRDADDLVDLAQQAVYDVTERRVSEDFAVLADHVAADARRDRGGRRAGGMMTGVPTGFATWTGCSTACTPAS